MSGANGHGDLGADAAVAAARPVMLVRYRPGVTGETARTVHVVPLPTDRQAGAAGALCGATLVLDDIETVTPGQGMPCTLCLLNQTLSPLQAGEPPSQVHRITGVLALPPTVTPRGPITWTNPPREDSLRLCREIDLFGALRIALNNVPPDAPHRWG